MSWHAVALTLTGKAGGLILTQANGKVERDRITKFKTARAGRRGIEKRYPIGTEIDPNSTAQKPNIIVYPTQGMIRAFARTATKENLEKL